MKQTRKWLAVLLSAVLALGLLPAAVLAEGDDVGTALTASSQTLTTGTYYLNDDLTLSSGLIVQSGAMVTLDLRGHILRGRGSGAGSDSGTVITVSTGATLNLRDTGQGTSHSYVIGENGLYVFDETLTGGHAAITGGVITGGYVSSRLPNPWEFGGGITVYGTLHMYGGTIAGNYAGQNGGGVTVVTDGSFAMYDGTICGNYALISGGGLMVNGSALNHPPLTAGTVILAGGAIEKNTVGDSTNEGTGGGAALIDGEIRMQGVRIAGNTSYGTGGGVSVGRNSSFVMESGEINSNTASRNGGGVYIDTAAGSSGGAYIFSRAEFTMTGSSTISGNRANIGGGVFVSGFGDGEAKSTFRMAGGAISGNTAAENGGGTAVFGRCAMSGAPKITGNRDGAGSNSNLYLNGHEPFTDGGLTAGTSIGVTVSDPPSGGNSSPVPIVYSGSADPGWFFSDGSAYEIVENKTAQERSLVLQLKDGGAESIDPYAYIDRAQLAARIQQHTSFGLSGRTSSSASAFSDVGHRSGAERNAIGVLYDEKIMSGMGNGTFNPDAADVTRAQAVVIIWRAAGSRSNTSPAHIPYQDVPGGGWYTAAINCLYAMGVLDDSDMDGNGNFAPDDFVTVETVDKWLAAYDASLSSGGVSSRTESGGSTRVGMVAEYYHYFKSVIPDSKRDRSKQPAFLDTYSCTEEEKEAITFWFQLGVIRGTSETTFDPYSAPSNAQIAALIHNINEFLDAPAAQASPQNLLSLGENEWYRPILESLVGEGLLSGDAGEYIGSNPHAPVLTANVKDWGANTGLATAAPTFSPGGGVTFDGYLSIALATETKDAKIYYTTNGSDPAAGGYLYNGPFTITSTTTIKAIAVRDGVKSEITTAQYILQASGSTGGNTGGSGGSSGGGKTGGSTTPKPAPSTTTTTTDNPDGSTTITATDGATGTVTETTTYPDGAVKVVETTGNGTVTTRETAANGVQVTTVRAPGAAVTASVTIPKGINAVTVTIAADVTPGTVAVDTKTGKVIRLSIPTADGLVVKLDHSADFTLVDRSKDFSDTANHWAEDSIAFVTAHELFQGTSISVPVFDPELPMTRVMLMTVLARLDSAGTDGGSIGYEQGMAWAVANGVSDGSDPDGQITREQLAAMLWRYAGSPASDSVPNHPDAGRISDYARNAMAWAVEAGILNGYDDGSLRPGANATRAVVAAMIQRFCATLV